MIPFKITLCKQPRHLPATKRKGKRRSASEEHVLWGEEQNELFVSGYRPDAIAATAIFLPVYI